MADASGLDLVISAFKSPVGAGLAFAALIDGGGEVLKGVKELAIVRRGEDNRLHIQEQHDMSAGATAYGGGTIGALVGILGGPIGMLIGGATGALIGGLGGKLIDTGIPDERLREIGALLAPNTSAIVALTDQAQAELLLAALAQGGGTTLTQTVPGDIPDRIAAAQAATDEANTGASSTE